MDRAEVQMDKVEAQIERIEALLRRIDVQMGGRLNQTCYVYLMGRCNVFKQDTWICLGGRGRIYANLHTFLSLSLSLSIYIYDYKRGYVRLRLRVY